MVKSISYDQNEILQWIIDLYLDGKPFELDPTYSKGRLYKSGIPEPSIKSDLMPQVDDCLCIDATDMPWDDESIRSVIFDPPFIGGASPTGNPTSRIQIQFGAYKNITQLYEFYQKAIREIYRILVPNGILVFKCQDVIEGRKQHWSHIEIYNMATGLFYGEDLFILLAKTRLFNWKKQFHARKYHCYFWVFRKLSNEKLG